MAMPTMRSANPHSSAWSARRTYTPSARAPAAMRRVAQPKRASVISRLEGVAFQPRRPASPQPYPNRTST